MADSHHMSDVEIRAFLTSTPAHTAALSTVRADGRPHVAPVWYDVDDDGTVLFNTGAATVKGKAILRTGQVSLCIDDERPPFTFVVVHGTCTVTEDPDEVLTWATRIGGRYMGADQADAYGRRNAGPRRAPRAGDADQHRGRQGHRLLGRGAARAASCLNRILPGRLWSERAPAQRLARRRAPPMGGDADRTRPDGGVPRALGSLNPMSKRRRILAISLVGLVLVGGTIAFRLNADGTSESSALAETVATLEAPETTVAPTTSTTVDPSTIGFQAAWARVPSVNLFDSPTASQPRTALSNPTFENVPLTFLVRRQEGNRILVSVPMRPNGTEAWVDEGDVQLAEVPNRIKVEVGARRLTVYKGRGDEVVMATNVAVGKDATPTPLGNFYVDISVAQNTYTPWILSVAGYSNELQSFGGGIGQIAIHGWSDTSVLGQNVSNGCVRVSFDDLWRLRDLAPVGTPVEIVA